MVQLMEFVEWSDRQLESAGLDRNKVESIARRLNKISKEMRRMGLYVYGASGSDCLIHSSRPTHIDDPVVNGGRPYWGRVRWRGLVIEHSRKVSKFLNFRDPDSE